MVSLLRVFFVATGGWRGSGAASLGAAGGGPAWVEAVAATPGEGVSCPEAGGRAVWPNRPDQ
jgi:hypothetical protein